MISVIRTPVIHEGQYTLKLKDVMGHYTTNGLFFDLFGALPLNVFLGYYDNTNQNRLVISLLRLTRLFALFKLDELFEKL